jgi:GTPase KRas protein
VAWYFTNFLFFVIMDLYRIVVLGDGGIGKTALIIQYCLNHFVEEYDPTIEDSYRKQATIDDKPCVLEVLDTAGQEEYRALLDQWIREGDGFLIMFSVTSAASFDRIRKFRDLILRVKESSAGNDVPIVLVGNKCDLMSERQVKTEMGNELAKSISCQYIETSAKNDINVAKPFTQVVKLIRSLKKQKPSKQKSRCTIL